MLHFNTSTMKSLFSRHALHFLAIIVTLSALVSPAQAQLRGVNTATVFQGNTIYYGGFNQTAQDSLQVSDSIAYYTYISHQNDVAPYLTWFWNKIGSGTATITLTFWQSNDNVNYFQLKAGVAQANYSKSYTLAANTWSEVDFARDSVRFDGRYLKTYFITSSTASVKGKLINQLKVNIK